MGSRVPFQHPRYRLVRPIAEGGMGKVYLSRDLLEDRLVALKLYPSRFLHERLRQEFLALRELHHPGIARALHLGQSAAGGAPFFTLEYVDGTPLEPFLAQAPPAAARRDPASSPRFLLAFHLLREATAALAYLHRRGLLHLDLKPENILVVPEEPLPRPVLIDFGLVRLVHAAAAPLSHATLPYAPPEVLEGRAPGPPADVYGLAATFYRAFSGRHPVMGTDLDSFTRAHRSQPVAALPEVPPPLERVLLRALAKDPERRFRDAGELDDALLGLPGLPERESRPAYHEPDFTGRARELARLEEWLGADRRAAPVLEIAAGAGWGKSRFLERAETVIETRGRNVLFLRAQEGERDSFLAECLRRAGVLRPPGPRERSARRLLLGELGDAARTGAGSASGRAALERGRVRQALPWVLPLLLDDTFLLIDDAHFGGPPLEVLIEELGRALQQAPRAPGGGIALTWLEEGGSSGPPPAWRREGRSSRIELGPLGREDALRIDLEGLDGALAGLSPARVRRLKAALHRQVGGHPLFYVRGLLDLAGDPSHRAGGAPEERLVRGLERLGGAEQEIARSLAALGRPSTPEEIAQIASRDPSATRQAIERLRRAGLVAASRPGGRVRIPHESVARALLQGLAPGDRQALHGRVASALAASARAERRESLLVEAAWLFFAAGRREEAREAARGWIDAGCPLPAAGAGRALEALFRAARAARRDPESSRRFLEAASDLLETLGRHEECFRVRSRLVEGWTREEVPRAELASQQAEETRLRRKLGSVCQSVGKTELARRHLEACLREPLERAAPLEALLARGELALLHHFRGDADLAREHARRGVAAWRALAPAARALALPTALQLHVVLGQVELRRLQFEAAAAWARAGLRLAERTGSQPNIALLLNNLALAQHLAGRFDAALATFRRAEAAARKLGDAAEVATIHANVAQILAKKGRLGEAEDLLDAMGDLDAVRQSKRLRVGCLYTRGLFCNLLRAEADDLWRQVGELAAEVGDAFLERFSRIYRAESLILSGRLSEARRVLAPQPASDPAGRAVECLKEGRRALLEALAGNRGRSRRLRRRARGGSRSLPRILEAWNRLHLGLAALETGDLSEAQEEIERARRVFAATGLAPGRLECALALGDLHARAAGGRLAAARRALESAARVPLQPPRSLSPRARELRAALLEARIILREAASEPGRAAAAGDGPLAAKLADVLARAAGDPALRDDPESRVELEVLAAAAARLRGDRQAARERAARLERFRGSVAARLERADRSSYLRRDPWERLGLEALRPLRGKPALSRRQGEALARVLEAAPRAAGPGAPAGSARAAIAEALEAAGRALGAWRVRLWAGARAEPLAGWEAPVAARRSAGAKPPPAGAILRAWCPAAGATPLVLEAERLAGSFSAADELFLDSAARALGPSLGTLEPAGPPPPDEEERSTEVLRRTRRLPETAVLSRTRTRPLGARGTSRLKGLLAKEGVVVAGREMERLLAAAAAIAAADLPVLVTGESGTGKDVLARLVHAFSPRAAGPFVTQSAAALPQELFEADLFGYEEGAFTGAERARTGFLFRAAGGTFHLEEVGELPAELQHSLLRVIEAGEVRPLGAAAARRIDVRFVASTNRDIAALVEGGEFRRDLFYRLNAARIHLPPLRERPDEIPALVAHYWREIEGPGARFPARSLDVLLAHDWPGNIRELVAVLRRLNLEAAGPPRPEDVRAVLGGMAGRRELFAPGIFRTHRFEDLERALEASYLRHLHEKHGGSLEAIAAELSTSVRGVYRRFERLGLKPKDFRRGRGSPL